MTIRSKTVEWTFPTRTTQLNAATRNDFSAITIYIPETISRKFLNVYVEIQCQENEATGGTSAGTRIVGIKLGAVSFNDQSKAETITQSFYPAKYRFIRDVTSYFETNFGSGTSQTCQVGFQIASQAIHALTAKIYITYQYDDEGQATKTKTVRIPLESPTGSLTATLAEIGTNQVPILTGGSGILPEASITIRDIWFEVYAHDNRSDTATDTALELSLDAEAGVSFGTWEMGQQGNRSSFVIWNRSDMVTTTTHAFKARATTATRFSTLKVDLCVNYEYDEASTSTVLTSVLMAVPQLNRFFHPSDSTLANAYRSQLKFMIDEPSGITLKQSAVALVFHAPGGGITGTVVALRAGSQSVRSYTATDSASANNANTQAFQHRIDSGGAQGAGVSIARGENTLTLDAYQTSNNQNVPPMFVQGYMLLNYTAAKHEQGSCAHNHTVRWVIQESSLTSSNTPFNITTFNLMIPEGQHWVTNVGFQMTPVCINIQTAVVLNALASSDEGGGWRTVCTAVSIMPETQMFWAIADASDRFKRHPYDPDTSRLDLRRTRTWRLGQDLSLGNDYVHCAEVFCTYNSMGTLVERAVTPAATAVPVTLYKADSTNNVVYSAASMSTGAYQFICFSTGMQMYATADRTGVSAGRSAIFTPSGFGFNYKWKPTGLSGLALWLRTDLGVTQSGTISAWADQSGQGNNGAQSTSGNRPTYLADGGDGFPSASFDGSTDLIEVTDAASLGSTTAFSASMWIRTGATFPTDGTIIAQWGATERFLLRVETGGNLVASISNGSAGTGTATAVLSASKYYHVAFTYDGAGTGNAGKLKVYLNGVQLTLSFSGTVPTSTGNPTTILSIGSRNAASTYFNGNVDDVVFVNGRALTEEEILLLYFYRPRTG